MIKTKEKKCKATGKANGFDSCGNMAFKRTYGLCDSCYRNWLLNTPEGKEKVQAMTIKVSASRVSMDKAITESKNTKSLGYLLTSTKNACHTFIKLRDKGKPCVSCGNPWNPDHQAGHWKKAELFSTIKFNENNIHNQCVGCNIHKDGNVQEYDLRVHLRIGEDGKQEIERLAAMDKKVDFSWDRIELEKTRKYYQAKTKELKL